MSATGLAGKILDQATWTRSEFQRTLNLGTADFFEIYLNLVSRNAGPVWS
jgi:hypothetical protein